MNNRIFKYLSVFLLGLILGYLIKGFTSGSSLVPATDSVKAAEATVKTMGQDNAPVTIVEYSDFQCPLCKKYYDESFHTIVDNYVTTGKVKYVFKQFPLNIHPQAPFAALSSECALEQNKFWEMHEALFEHQSEWSGKSDYMETFKKLATDLGLDQNKFNTCLDSQKYRGSVETDYEEAINRSVRGTPTFYINDQLLVGAQETAKFTEMLDNALSTEQK